MNIEKQGVDIMLPVLIFLGLIVVAYSVISYYNDKRKEEKGICKTTGGSCSSPTGCTCGDAFEEHAH